MTNKADAIAGQVHRLAKKMGVEPAHVWSTQPDYLKAYRAAKKSDDAAIRKAAKDKATVGDLIEQALYRRAVMMQAGDGGHGYLAKSLAEIRTEIRRTEVGRNLEAMRRQFGHLPANAVLKSTLTPEMALAWTVAKGWAEPTA